MTLFTSIEHILFFLHNSRCRKKEIQVMVASNKEILVLIVRMTRLEVNYGTQFLKTLF